MTILKDQLRTISKEMHEHFLKKFTSDTHDVILSSLKFDVKPKGAFNLNPEESQPMDCHINEQGQVVCGPGLGSPPDSDKVNK